MLSISNPRKGGSGGGYYFKYYSNHSDEKGRWMGKGVSSLGLGEFVNKKQFNALLEGFSTTGTQKLVQNAGSSRRQGFWDLTLSAPKSVSVMYMAAPASVKTEIQEALTTATQKTLEYVENFAGFSRRGKGGEVLEKAALTFATFFHNSSRANDPQLHFHCLLLNVGIREDGTTAALHTRQVFREKMNAGAIFQLELAHELTSRLKIEIEPEANGFHVKGIPRKLCEDCSSRRHDILEELARRGTKDAISAKDAAIKTRSSKRHIRQTELFEKWERTAANHHWLSEDVLKLLGKCPRSDDKHRRSELEFKKSFEAELRKIPPQFQTHLKMSRVAAKLGLRFGMNSEKILKGIEAASLPKMGRFYRVEYRPLFPRAVVWNPAKNIKLPVIAFRDRPQKWGYISWKKELWTAAGEGKELRIQERRLFPKAPKWSPIHGLSLPALRVGKKSEDYSKQMELKERDRSFRN
jgi:conjugative relaxase-like TrwC/TraI family protein